MNWHYQFIRTAPAHLFLLCLLVLSFCATCDAGKTVVAHRNNIICIDQERDALLKFKNQIEYDNECGLMSSWGNSNTPDCCTWKGVTCSNQSGHVVGLNLSGAPYQWRCLYSQVFSPSLGELKRLKYLDLSSNYFYDMDIPNSIGSLVNLIHLNLSNSGFSGNIPHLLGNLTLLTSLDLSYNDGLFAQSLNWISQLTFLREISLSGNYQIEATDWTQSIGSLPLLEVLQMDYCDFSMPLPFPSIVSSNLRIVSLPGNDVNSSSIFQWLFNSSNYSLIQQSLVYLDLSDNFLQGPIPDAILNLKFLTYLDLSQNSLSGTIPDAIGNLQVLTYLGLSRNSLSGIIPDAIGNLEFLTYLDLSQNSLSSIIPDAIANLQSLMHMDLSYNRLEGSIPSAIGDSHSKLLTDLSNNHLQGPVPSSLGGASSLSHLDLSNNHLEGTIPASIGNMEYLVYLDVSSNNLSGVIPCNFEIRSTPAYVNFSCNNLSGSLPKYFSNFEFESIEAFQGNPNLHTDEFQSICNEGSSLSNEEQVGGDDGNDDNKIYPGLYVSIALGFYTGFWVFCGTLTLKNSWRQAYFRFLDHIIDEIYVVVAVYLARFRSNSQM